MPRIMIAMLLTALTILSSYHGGSSEARVPDLMTVTVAFSGLMVFHQEQGRLSYEVGVLGPDVADGHEFTVGYEGVVKDRKHLPNGRSWTLKVTNSEVVPGTGPVEIGHQVRRPDNQAGQYDFSWIVDLEGSEFHGSALELKAGLLKPIIHLPDGSLYTRFKSGDLQRWQGSGTPSDFGFLPETIALGLKLKKGQVLVLKDDTSGTEVFRLPYIPNQAPYLISIKNVRHPLGEDSDFRLYYRLFPNIPKEKQYDFRRNGDSKMSAFNPAPMEMPLASRHHFSEETKSMIMIGCCAMDCSSVLLGKRTAALK